MPTQANIIVGIGDGFLKIGTYGQAEGSASDIGATEGGCTLEIPREYYEKRCDQYIGTLEMIKTSEDCTLTISMAEATLDNLRMAIDYPSGALVGSELNVGGNATVNELTLYLNVVGPSSAQRKYTFHKVVSTGAATHSYKKDDKTIYECEFRVLQDTSKTANQQLFSIVDTGGDTTAPTILLTTPSPGGTVTKDTTDPVVLTITETNAMNENTIVYGANDDATIMIINTTGGANTLVAGTIAYDSTLKTVTFTPDSNWNASDTLIITVSTGLADVSGNNLAAPYIAAFSVTA